ncbi:MAG TPA: hypothetical protein VJ302_06000 [Blastocatellia bacterium]|nr:hypothetical protein [Blastocatellia bacterium]
MFCPSCATEANDQTKFCTKCGLNLRQIKDAMVAEDGGLESWHPEYQAQGRRFNRRKARIERRKKKTPEENRLDEIKGGVITTSVGFGLLIFLGIFFGALAETEGGPDAEILRALRFVGLIPFMVGLGILFNGLFVSKRLVEIKRRQEQEEVNRPMLFSETPETAPAPQLSQAPHTPVGNFSVTENTTTKLREPAPVPKPGE